ncbi:thermostable hemolysin [Agarivorans sp.]|uniref:thermostable hemolysin n=1 Tax=Agarivorans sp. TaxID=1872412 RepID=UPI003D074E6F
MKYPEINVGTSTQLNIVGPEHPMWQNVVTHVQQRYQLAFMANVKQSMPAYLALIDNSNILSVCGFRAAENEALYLEQYLDCPAEQLVSKLFNCSISRANLVEFGHLASFTKGLSPLHFYLIAELLVEQGFEWCIFTATDPLHALMMRLGLEPKLIAEASPSKVNDAQQIWGSYYDTHPKVYAGNLSKGLSRLRMLQQRKIKQA